ncbi:arrestin domain-containing protein 4-like [Strongylocentrotus purpuratus]|uniref:Arrestin C-terminal-like domain-containing protein n=1 Tax=Strongylocentrotus purpuratus TaxID=7668 RepID=A0A7M7HFV2_STRPU|nr:arrestin domain-containing protein 4-like [Strongylocentrotus purpuratus]
MSSKLEVFDIVFENNDVDIFKPGDVIQGFVLVVLSAEKKHIRGIRVKFKGKTKTEWRNFHDDGEDFLWKEVLFKHTALVFGEDDACDRSYILPAGEHKFPFRFRLPLGLPPELYCKFAQVSYMVKAVIDRPRKYDHSAKRAFRIRPVVDLNIIPEVLHPIGDQQTTNEGCLCCETGPITLDVNVNKRGFVVGESMWVSGCLDNQSNSDVSVISCTLTQTLTFFAKSGWRTDDKRIRDDIVEIEIEGCPSYQKKAIEPTAFRVPPIVPCAFETCPNIFLEYSLQISAIVGFETPACSLRLPISIGTIAALNTIRRPSVNMAVTHQSELKRMVPPPPSYDIAVSGFREVEPVQSNPSATRTNPARLFPDLPIISNYTASDSNVLPVSCSPRSPSGKGKYSTSPTSEKNRQRKTTSPAAGNFATLPSNPLPASYSPMSPTSRAMYDTLPSANDRRSGKSAPVMANPVTTSPAHVIPPLSSPRSSTPRLRYDSTPTSERGESASLLSNRMTAPDANTYYDTSLGYGQLPLADPWRTQNQFIRDDPQDQSMARTRGRIAEAFV